MAARRVFVISGTGLSAYHRHGSKLLDPFSFDAHEDGLAEFERYLERFPDDVTCVLADVVEEEFREETVPHVFAWERGALLRARAARAYPGARYLHSTRLGREPGGRRDDRVLLSAITRPEALASWLAPMAKHETPLAGIYSPAMLTGAMLKALGAEEGEHVLVVSRQSGGGLRQTCFRRGKLRFSRLAAMPDPAAGGYESHVLAEIERTRRYLGSLPSGAADDDLDVHVLSHGEPLDALRRELRRDAGGEDRPGWGLVDLATVARRLGLRRWGGEPDADRLFVHLLASRPPPNHYATPDQTRRLAMLRTRLVLKAASAGVVAGAFLFGGVVALEGATARSHARSLALHTALYERRYRPGAGDAASRPGRAGHARTGGIGGKHPARTPGGPDRSARAVERRPRPASRGYASRASHGGQATIRRLPSGKRAMIAPGRDPPAQSRGAIRASCFRSHASVRASSRSTATTVRQSIRSAGLPPCSPRSRGSTTCGS